MTKNAKDSLGDRIKGYESCSKNFLTRRMPVIIRLDGNAFSTLTKKLEKPYDTHFRDVMMGTAEYLVRNIMNCKLAYVQSDEISLLMVDYGSIETDAWFNNNVQKMVSISASMATAKFNDLLNNSDVFPKEKRGMIKQDFAMFDSRSFNVPREDVTNSIIWRQQDATRNSIQGLGQANFSHTEMQGKNNSEVQDMLMIQKNINWNDMDTYFKRGGCIYRGVVADRTGPLGLNISIRTDIVVDMDVPIFTQDRDYIERHLYPENDSKLYKYVETVYACVGRDIASEILEGVPQISDVLIDTANSLMDEE